MQNQIFEAALGITNPWYIKGVDFDVELKHLSIHIDFVSASRFAYPGIEGPVHDTQIKRYRHLNFFQHECHLEVRVPRVKLPNGKVALIEPDWAGKLNGFTLLFEALVLTLARLMPFAAVAKFHVIAHTLTAVDKMRRVELKTDPALQGLRWSLLKDRSSLNASQCADLDGLIAHITTKRTARAWLYREQLREILDRKQSNVMSGLLAQWCTNVMRSKVEPMKEVAKMIRNHFDGIVFDGIVAWAQTRQSNGFFAALNGLFQADKRKARGYTRIHTMRTEIFSSRASSISLGLTSMPLNPLVFQKSHRCPI